MLFSRKRTPSILPDVILGNKKLEQVNSHKHLGMIFTNNVSWTEHIESTVSKYNRIIGMFKPSKYKWPRAALEICYKSFIRSVLEYGDVIYDNCNIGDKDHLESVQLEAARLVTGAKKRTSHESLYKELGWQTLSQRRHCKKLIKIYDVINGRSPNYLCSILNDYKSPCMRNTRCSANNNFIIPKYNSTLFINSFIPSNLSAWNSLEPSKRSLPSKFAFKSYLKGISIHTPLIFIHDIPRIVQVHFTQIRMGFSNLKHDLYKKDCIEDNMCACGESKEDQRHFYLKRNRYTSERSYISTYNIVSLYFSCKLFGKQ